MSDPYHEPAEGEYMQFRLTFADRLFSTGNDSSMGRDRRAAHKHEIRRKFHPQLKRLWEITPFLNSGTGGGPSAIVWGRQDQGPQYKASYLAKKHRHFDWSFVPLVTKDLNLMCGIDVLFLRPQHPGGLIKCGDIDGRLKTLLDALSIPDANQGYDELEQEKEYTPMYTLLENDNLITKISVETDQLLELCDRESEPNQARLVITVTLRPYEMHVANMQFG